MHVDFLTKYIGHLLCVQYCLWSSLRDLKYAIQPLLNMCLYGVCYLIFIKPHTNQVRCPMVESSIGVLNLLPLSFIAFNPVVLYSILYATFFWSLAQGLTFSKCGHKQHNACKFKSNLFFKRL
jgi:hypothetical protein